MFVHGQYIDERIAAGGRELHGVVAYAERKSAARPDQRFAPREPCQRLCYLLHAIQGIGDGKALLKRLKIQLRVFHHGLDLVGFALHRAGIDPRAAIGAGASGHEFHIFLAIDHLERVAFHLVQRGYQDARVAGEVMDDVNAAAGKGVEGCRLALIHRLRQILEQVLARRRLRHKGRVNQVEHDKRNAPGGRLARQGIAELVRIPGTRPTVRVAGDFLERGDLLLGAVFQHREVFLLQSEYVIAGLVGHQRGDQHQCSARGEFDFRVVLFVLVFVFVLGLGEDKSGTHQRGDYGDVAGKLAANRHPHTPFCWREKDSGNPRRGVSYWRREAPLGRPVYNTSAVLAESAG